MIVRRSGLFVGLWSIYVEYHPHAEETADFYTIFKVRHFQVVILPMSIQSFTDKDNTILVFLPRGSL